MSCIMTSHHPVTTLLPSPHTFQNDVFAINYISIDFMWRQQNKEKDLFEEILNDVVKYNPLC